MGKYNETLKEFYRLIDANDWTALEGLVDNSVVLSTPMGEFRGLPAIVEFCKGFYTAFPKLNHEMIEYIEEGDRTATRVKFTGTHTGPLVSPDGQSIPATGKSIEMIGSSIATWRDGKILQWDVVFNQVAMLGQLGLMPVNA